MKNVIVLGSTGTLGIAALKILKKYQKYFCVYGLVAGKNWSLLSAQAKTFSPSPVLFTPVSLLASRDGQKKIHELVGSPEVDIVMNLIPGLAGLPASKAALKSGKTLLLANKESLVAEGKKLMKMSKPGQIIPLDSEHNAIFEILKFAGAHNIQANIEAIYLPCSGGSLRNHTPSQLKTVTPKEVLEHPVWKMGPKITVESATLINKGFEILEAHYLFNLPLRKIKVFLHPDGQVHGVVKFRNAFVGGRKKAAPAGAALAYMSPPSMLHHIENALRHVAGLSQKTGHIQAISAKEVLALASKRPRHSSFPGIKVVLTAFRAAGKNADLKPFLRQEERLINLFLKNKISFSEIFRRLF